MNQVESFYKGKRVFVTGAHGFKGSWLCLWLEKLGATVMGLGLDSKSSALMTITNKVSCDVRSDGLIEAIAYFQPQIIFHLAAQPIVATSMYLPVETISINVVGTANVLDAACQIEPNPRVVVITSDKCYRASDRPVTENSPLGGSEPYSTSKACAELVAAMWRSAFGLEVRTVRAGNVIGGGDLSPHRIIPDLVRAVKLGGPLIVRNPDHVRPWQHVLDCVASYLVAGMADHFPDAINIGPETNEITVEQLIGMMKQYLPGIVVEVGKQIAVEHRILTLDTSLMKQFGCRTVLTIEKSVSLTAKWYARWMRGEDMINYSNRQIDDYTSIAALTVPPGSSTDNWLSDLTP